ncbi:NADH-quinone oxidoreductase subunit C [Bacillus sp. NTK071]|uniref:NADH-quinone oxidoreductase subunit C n=1 Tax=Bacillus sp. NTK071 TaxID=2802175 RepID=UPI001A8E32EB|nr:NADH-quinone oxidoreductase subunit C [Bacillus sp. NTK071]MBN8210950.1 NADH-quinone oxidoreductase subunit C [Bacillus sp. NTK071]
MTDGKTPEELAEEKRKAVEEAKQKAAELRKEREARKAAEANSDGDLEKKKAVAAAKAKAAAIRKKKELEQNGVEKETLESSGEEDLDLAKKKAVAAAKAKAAAIRKKKELESNPATELNMESEKPSGEEDLDLAKKKAVAAAKAKAAALKKKKESGEAVYDDKAKAAAAAKAKAAALKKKSEKETGDDEKAKAIAIAKAKAKAKAAAAAKAKGSKTEEPVIEEEKPSPNQPALDRYVQIIRENLGEDLLEDAYINRLAKHVPTLVARKETYLKIAQFLKYNELLAFDYLSETHGTDFETHMEIYNHLYSYQNNQSVALKVKLDRNEPVIDSLTSLWEGANWPEREGYDLLGITFLGHPNLTRIMMPDDWVGHPLRKDYEPYDVEV